MAAETKTGVWINRCDCDADVDKTQALYENGLLNLRVPLNCPDPYKNAKKVKVRAVSPGQGILPRKFKIVLQFFY